MKNPLKKLHTRRVNIVYDNGSYTEEHSPNGSYYRAAEIDELIENNDVNIIVFSRILLELECRVKESDSDVLRKLVSEGFDYLNDSGISGLRPWWEKNETN